MLDLSYARVIYAIAFRSRAQDCSCLPFLRDDVVSGASDVERQMIRVNRFCQNAMKYETFVYDISKSTHPWTRISTTSALFACVAHLF